MNGTEHYWCLRRVLEESCMEVHIVYVSQSTPATDTIEYSSSALVENMQRVLYKNKLTVTVNKKRVSAQTAYTKHPFVSFLFPFFINKVKMDALRANFKEKKVSPDYTLYMYKRKAGVILCIINGVTFYKERLSLECKKSAGTHGKSEETHEEKYTDFKPLPEWYTFSRIITKKEDQVSAEVLSRIQRYTNRRRVVGQLEHSFGMLDFENVLYLMGFQFTCMHFKLYLKHVTLTVGPQYVSTDSGLTFEYTMSGLEQLVRFLVS